MTLLRRDISILAISIAVAFISRFFVLFVGRPTFVGWFNHSPYYWVQSRSIIENGSLAYGDMPLLFAFYAALAKGIRLFGVPLDPAIISASRLVMAVAPALVPIAIYILAKKVAGDKPLSWPTKCLVFASGFLPLTFANMPENLQKNMVGLLLLAFLLLALFQWLRAGKIRQLLLLFLLLVTICAVHLGSAFASLLLVAALILDSLLSRSSLNQIIRIFLLTTAVAMVVAFGIYVFDPAAAERVMALAAGLLPREPGEILFALLAVAIWLVLMMVLWRWLSRRTTADDDATATLARVISLWLILLLMPLWPGDIGVRLILFIPLEAVVLLVLFLSMFRKGRFFRYAAAAVTLVFCSMSMAEAVALSMAYPGKTQTARQLAAAADKYGLSRGDLVITPYGVNPIANWFLGTKASLITAVQRNVTMHYDRVFVLNTLERREPGLEAGECRLVQSEDDRYWSTRHDIPMGEGALPDPDYNMFAFYLVERLPEQWVFDGEGNWAGWGDCSQGAALPGH